MSLLTAMVLLLHASVIAPATPSADAVPAYRLTCRIISKDLVLSKFRLSAAGPRNARRFQLEPLERAPWAERVTAAVIADTPVGMWDSFEFLAGGTRYLLNIEELAGSPLLTAKIDLHRVNADGSVDYLAAGACAGQRELDNLNLPSMDRLDKRPPRSRPVRYIKVTASTQDTCLLVTPDGQVIKVDLDSVFGEKSTINVIRRQGETWPPDSFLAPMSYFATIIIREGAGAREDFVVGGVGQKSGAGNPVSFSFNISDQGMFVTFTGSHNTLIGSGSCHKREAAPG